MGVFHFGVNEGTGWAKFFQSKTNEPETGQSRGLFTKPTGGPGMESLFLDGHMRWEPGTVAIHGGLGRGEGMREEATASPRPRFKKRTWGALRVILIRERAKAG
jgi:hypothetical protein